jgi:hypothetical protein
MVDLAEELAVGPADLLPALDIHDVRARAYHVFQVRAQGVEREHCITQTRSNSSLIKFKPPSKMPVVGCSGVRLCRETITEAMNCG